MESSMMKRFLLLLLFTTANAFVPARQQQQHQHHRSMLVMPQAAPSLMSLNTSFDDYSQTEPDQNLAYQDTVVGTGDIANSGKVVTVAYKGTLMSNRKTFDEGQISFRLGAGKVITGWEQGIVGMKVGGKRVLKIPPRLAYGERGAGAVIPPGAHLVFDCELKGIASNQIEETIAEVNPFNLLTFVLVAGNILYFAFFNH